jgi:hypothetical protein
MSTRTILIPGSRSAGGKCVPHPAIWKTPTWNALNFSMSEPHYYRYSFESEGAGSNARFTATAQGDLDCDGIPSRFERAGSAQGGSSGLYMENPLE